MVNIRNLLKICGCLGALEFLSSMVASLFISFITNSSTFAIILGIALILGGIIIIFFAFFRNDDPSLRASHLTVGIPSVIIGITTCCLTERWFITAHLLTRAVIFTLITFSIIGLLCFLFPFATNLICHDILEGSQLDRTKELTLYIWCNLFLCLIYGLILGSPISTVLSTLYKNTITVGIANWFIGLVMFALLGLLIETRNISGANSSIYDSAKLSSTTQ